MNKLCIITYQRTARGKLSLFKESPQLLLYPPIKHSFSAMKRKSRKRKHNILKRAKRKKARHVARTIDIVKKVAPDLPVGKTCEKEDLFRDIVKKLGKREQK